MLLIFVFVSSGAFVSGSGQFGVSAGDWVKYRVIRRPGQGTPWIDNHDWVKIEVLTMSGTSVTIVETWIYPNGKTFNWTESADSYIQPANLTIGDEVFSETCRPHRLNSSVCISLMANRTYCEESRNACLAELSYTQPYFGDTLDAHQEYWWDKETGILLEKTYETTIERIGNDSKSTASSVITETNLWRNHTNFNFTAFLSLTILGISLAFVIGMVALKRNTLKKRLQPS